MLKNTLNKRISTPIAIGIILILAIIVGGFTWWQYSEIEKEKTELPELEFPEKEEKETEEVKEEIMNLLIEIEEESNIDFSEIKEIEFTWNGTQIQGEGFDKEITDEEYVRIKELLLSKGFDVVIERDETLAESVLGLQKDQFVCNLRLRYQEIDFFACGELPRGYEEPKW